MSIEIDSGYSEILDIETGDIQGFTRELENFQAVNGVEKFVLKALYYPAYVGSKRPPYSEFSTVFASEVVPMLTRYADGAVIYSGDYYRPCKLFAEAYNPRVNGGSIWFEIVPIIDGVEWDYYAPALSGYHFSYPRAVDRRR